MKIRDMRTKSDTELSLLVTESRQKLATAHVDLKTKEVKQVREIRNLKTDIARALTIMSERELAELEKSNG